MPDYSDPEQVAEYLAQEADIDDRVAEEVAQEVAREAEHELGDPEGLINAIKDGAGMVLDTALELVSGVDVPAVDSKFVMMKSDKEQYDKRATAPVLLDKDATEERRVGFAPAMIPREPDKEGDVVGTATVEDSAWQFLKSDDTGIDTDHNLIDGKGEVVESWVLKEERTFDLPGGGEETYPAGTWMLGIQWQADPWERIKAGDIQGLSIYGTAEQIQLKSAKTITVTEEKQEFGEWPWPRSKEGLTQCEEELAGEVNNEYAVCRAWASEAGVDISESAKNLDDPAFAPGDAVMWTWQGEPVHGRVADIHEQYTPPNADSPITGEDGEAVYSIHEWDDEVEAFREQNVAKPESSLEESQLDMPSATDDTFAQSVKSDDSQTGDMGQADQSDPSDGDPDADADADADPPETVSVEADAKTLSVRTEKAGRDEIESVLEILVDSVDEDTIKQATDMLVGDGPSDADVDGASDHHLAEMEGKQVEMNTLVDMIASLENIDATADEIADALAPIMNGEDMDEDDEDEDMDMEESADDTDAEDVDKSADDILWKGRRGMPDTVTESLAKDTSDGDSVTSRADVLDQ